MPVTRSQIRKKANEPSPGPKDSVLVENDEKESDPNRRDGPATRIIGRKRKISSLMETTRKPRRLRESTHGSEEDSGTDEEVEGIRERNLLPNDLLIEGGNRTAFKHKLLSGEELVVNFLDLYHASLARFINENVLHLACDLIMREKSCEPKKGWVYMHETALVSKILSQESFDHTVLPFSRMEDILKSNVLFVPINTLASRHWSLLVLTNLRSVYDAAMAVASPKRGPCDRPSLQEDQTKPLAIHFDSLKSSGHKTRAKRFKALIEYGITDAWKRRYKASERTPMFKTFLSRFLPITEARVQQQTDGCTCGWRAADALRFIAEHGNTERSKADTDWVSVCKKEVDTRHVQIAESTLRFMQSKIVSRMTDLPSLLFPVHSVLDEVCCSVYESDLENLNHCLATFFKRQQGNTEKARWNSKKIVQAQKFDVVHDAVVMKMKRKGLNMRRKLGRDVKMSASHCRTISKYLFHYPRGANFAKCLYYTRYNYPDSMLVCTGVNILLYNTPKLFGESLASSASRVPKSKRVHYQMAVFLDWGRSKARHWDTIARFRLQELLIHFTGISEIILRVCCRQAKYIEENEQGSVSEQVQEVQEVVPSKCIVIDSDDGRDTWSFHRSIHVEDGPNENGQIRCLASPFDIDSALPSCLSASERVANDAILDRISDFETHCKRILQLSTPKLKISNIDRIVTGSSMATIPTTFTQSFREQLFSRIKMMWGHVLSDNFLQCSVEPILSRVIGAAKNYFERNGKLFLDIQSPPDALVSEPVAMRANQSRDPVKATVAKNATAVAPASAPPTTVEVVERTVRSVESFGLGVHTTCLRRYTASPLHEFLSIFFYMLQGCQGHKRSDSFLCGDLGIQKWGSEMPECQERLHKVWKTFEKTVKNLEADYSKATAAVDGGSFERYITRLKFDVLVRAASRIADSTDLNAQSKACLYKSDVFCYEVPSPYRDDSRIKIGREFRFNFHGQDDTVLWHGVITGVTCVPFRNEEAGISFTGERCTIGDFPIDQRDAPRLHKMKLSVCIQCNVDLWSDARDVMAHGNGFVGVRTYECVRIVFAFHNGKSEYVQPHPVKSNYTHSFLGVVTSPYTTTDGARDHRNPLCVGPQQFDVEVIVHDDVSQKSGCRCSIQDLIKRFHKAPERGTVTYTGCYLMPLDDMSVNEDVWQYNGLCLTPNLPIPFKLALLDASMADAYHEEERRVHYDAMKAIHCSNMAELLSFPSRRTLEAEQLQQVQSAALQCDRRLNREQLNIIGTVLREWRTREAPNNTINLTTRAQDVREYLRKMGTVSNASLNWWGSSSCFIQGPPGTGKTRMLAALLSVVLEHLEPTLRILVACETNKALDDIFVNVLNNFRGKPAAYKRVHESLVRIGRSKVKVVRDREVGHMRERQRKEAVESARVVFTTFGSSHRDELRSTTSPFSLILFEETCLVKESMALHALTVALRLRFFESSRTESREVKFVCVGDPRQLKDKDYSTLPVRKQVDTHFFARVFDNERTIKGDMRMMLRRQYRMNPALASFVSRQFYHGKLITETDGELLWKDNALFKGLREHTRFPLCNMMVVDTSLEEERAHDKLGDGRSYYNPFEIKVIVNMLTSWCESFDAKQLIGKLTIITTYARQRDELVQHLRAKNLYFPVSTVDELQGGENDIVIVSLVRARSTKARDLDMHQPGGSGIGFVALDERVNVAMSRARQCCMVLGFAKHIGKHCPSWRNFFAECTDKANSKEEGTHGYFRPRYVDFNKDLRFSPFTPSYMG